MSIAIGEVRDLSGTEHEVYISRAEKAARKGDQAKIDPIVDSMKDIVLIFKMVERNQLMSLHEAGKERLGRIIGGETARHDAPDAALASHQAAIRLREDRIRIDVPPPAEWIPPARSHEVALALGLAQRLLP